MKFRKIITITLVIFTPFLLLSPSYSLSEFQLRPSASFDSDSKRDSAKRFNDIAEIISRVIKKHFSDGQPFTLKQFLEKLYSEEAFKTNPEKIHDAADWTLQIYSDVSDTIFLPPIGEEQFSSHEVKLMELVSKDIPEGPERNSFIEECKKGYELFSQIRRNPEIDIRERYMAWLKPFIGKLHNRHFSELVEDWRFKDTYLEAVALIRKRLGVSDDFPIVSTIESGNLVNMNLAAVDRQDVKRLFRDNDIVMKIDGIELVMDRNGYFQGELVVHGNLFYASAKDYPEDSLVIGDDPMEKYGFGTRGILLNVQTFSKAEAETVIERWLQKRNTSFNKVSRTLKNPSRVSL